MLCSVSCDGCGDYSGVITSLIGHNRVIVSQTTEAVVAWGALAEHTEDECAADAAELALPSAATVLEVQAAFRSYPLSEVMALWQDARQLFWRQMNGEAGEPG